MRQRSWRVSVALAAALQVSSYARGAAADGGRVCASDARDGLRATLFLAPTPLQVGTAELAVLVQADPDGKPVAEARVWFRMGTAADVEVPIGNGLLHATQAEISSVGPLELAVRVEHGPTRLQLACRASVEAAPHPLRARWPLLALPPVAIALFAWNRWLARRQTVRRRRRHARPHPAA